VQSVQELHRNLREKVQAVRKRQEKLREEEELDSTQRVVDLKRPPPELTHRGDSPRLSQEFPDPSSPKSPKAAAANPEEDHDSSVPTIVLAQSMWTKPHFELEDIHLQLNDSDHN
jgi:hypothetical protein